VSPYQILDITIFSFLISISYRLTRDIGDKQLSPISEEINIEIKGVKETTDKKNGRSQSSFYAYSEQDNILFFIKIEKVKKHHLSK
jgi:hypothetical protein